MPPEISKVERTPSCTFMLLLRNESFKTVQPTLESILAFRDFAYAAPNTDLQILCVCGAQFSSVAHLKKYAAESQFVRASGFEDPKYSVYAQLDWDKQWQEAFTLYNQEVVALFDIGRRRVFNNVVCLIEPGKTIEGDAMNTLLNSIRFVGENYRHLVVSWDKSSSAVPDAAVLANSVLMQGWAIHTASQGPSVVIKAGFLGQLWFRRSEGFWFSRTGHNKVEYNVPWLIAQIAFDYQTNRPGDLKLLRDCWTIGAASPTHHGDDLNYRYSEIRTSMAKQAESLAAKDKIDFNKTGRALGKECGVSVDPKLGYCSVTIAPVLAL